MTFVAWSQKISGNCLIDLIFIRPNLAGIEEWIIDACWNFCNGQGEDRPVSFEELWSVSYPRYFQLIFNISICSIPKTSRTLSGSPHLISLLGQIKGRCLSLEKLGLYYLFWKL